MMQPAGIASFETRLFSPEAGVYDPPEIHHEFNQGLHGRKADLDAVLEGTELYEEWTDNEADFISRLYPKKLLGRAVLVGVANGTNRIARDTADKLDCGAIALETHKINGDKPVLTPEAIELLQEIGPSLAVVLEDVATRGTNSAAVVGSVHAARPSSLRTIEVVNTVQRGVLEWLEAIGVTHHSMIKRLSKDYQPADCIKNGYCANGSHLVKYKKS